MKSANSSLFILIDPVLGDEAGLYVPLAVAESIRDLLLPLASCITPNRFELAWLSGYHVTDAATATAAARKLGTPEVLATSIPTTNDQLTTLLITPSGQLAITTPRLTQVPHGTGDFLSGLYLAARLGLPPSTAFEEAMAILARAISLSAGTVVLDVAGALHRP
jgi:pyridoxine kinase